MNYLVIEGNIGAGKTTLATMLAEEINARLILEQYAENPFLPRFYNEPGKYAFPLELSFLADRYRQHKEELMSRELFSPLAIADYYFSKSLIFAGITLPEDEFRLYRQLYDIIHQHLPIPDLYVYLHLPVERLVDNIISRGRQYEKDIDKDYLKELQDGYFDFMKSRDDLRFLVLDTRKVDFVNNYDDFVKIKKIIFESVFNRGITRVIL